MSSLRTVGKGTRRAILALLVVAVAGAGMPVVEVHAHDDAVFGHEHDSHDLVHHLQSAQLSHEGEDRESTGTANLHAHADSCVSVALTMSFQPEISFSAGCRSYVLRPVGRPPDKPVRPLYRPPIT